MCLVMFATGCVGVRVTKSSRIQSVEVDPDGAVWVIGTTTLQKTDDRSIGNNRTIVTQWLSRCLAEVKPDEPGGKLKCEKLVIEGLD